MRKIIMMAMALLAVCLPGEAQKFLDIYKNSNVVSSVKAADVDSMVVGEDNNIKYLYFYHDGKAFHHAITAGIDSVKVYDLAKAPLVYMGIVGFNQELYEKPFGLLDKNKAGGYKSFVNGLTRKDGTLLYYAVDHALDMLQNQSFPSQVGSVNLITFTDGLDQGSLMMNGNYTTDQQYLDAVSQRISEMRIKDLPLTAYSLGLRGSDVTDYQLFQNNLKKLASSDDTAFEVSSMSAVRDRLQNISDQIISVSTKQTVSLKIPGQSNGTLIRFTFNGSSATNSTMYIEGIFNLADRSLRNVTYYGLKAENGETVQGIQNGIFVTFTFTGLQREDGNGLIPTNSIRQYYKSPSSSSWQENSEFTPANNTQTSVSHSGAVIMLVLDCSSSLGSQFSNMQSYANDFIDRVANNAAVDVERPFGNVGYFELTCPDGNHPHLIDLGLPSGTKWACCNVGAAKPEAYGVYYAWGETERKDVYNWSTYIHCNGSSSSCHYLGSDIAGTQYDVAHVKWGGSWVMPTLDQFKELLNNCTSVWTSENGINGRKFTGPNGRSLFLPAAGYREGRDLYYAGSYGYYWSSTQNPSNASGAFSFYFNSGCTDWYYSYRYYGRSVRPVVNSSDDSLNPPPGQPTGDGTITDPYNVSAAQAAGSGTGVYVKGFIVGYVEGQDYATGAHFTSEGCEVKTNILIAASASETNVDNCMPIQLPSGDVRTGINLHDNPGNYGKEVLLYGNIERYFGVTGVKSVTYAEIGGNGVGTKP